MATTYTKSLATDFGASFKISQFCSEVEDSSITTSFNGINKSGDVIDIIFADTLSSTDETTLNTLISNHTPLMTMDCDCLSMTITDVTDTSYKMIGTILFCGTLVWNYTKFSFISMMDSGGTSYDIQIYDITNDLEIGSKNFTNTTLTRNMIMPISNLPYDEAIFEIRLKVNGSTTARVTTASMMA